MLKIIREMEKNKKPLKFRNQEKKKKNIQNKQK